jgi:acyl-CoA dehydrogenase
MWNSAAMAFAVGPLLTVAAIDALYAHGSDELKKTYLAKLVSGEWTGTMQLTEPQAGSDVGALRTRAERASDGTYRLKGQKIFITYGEHDLTDNIIHFVLARLPDAPPGTRGISLFLVPKFLLNADGSPGKRNDVRAHSVEHKLGIHGSPTCTMIFGDEGGATGFPHRRRECGHGLHVHDDEPGAACDWRAGRWHCRARLAAGFSLCARAQAGPHARNEGDGVVADH